MLIGQLELNMRRKWCGGRLAGVGRGKARLVTLLYGKAVLDVPDFETTWKIALQRAGNRVSLIVNGKALVTYTVGPKPLPEAAGSWGFRSTRQTVVIKSIQFDL